MEKKKNEGSTTYTIESPSKAGMKIANQIFSTMAKNEVEPDEILPILGEAVVRFLATIAEPLGYEKEELVHAFGDGIANAEIEFKEEL